MELPVFAHRGRKILQNEGLSAFSKRTLRYCYNTLLRPLLPTTGYWSLNGVKYREKKLLDESLPWSYQGNDLSYEDAIVSSLRENTSEGDHVCVIGGGLGVSTVVAAKHVGASGRVTAFEGSSYRLKHMSRVVKLNDIAERGELRHAIVGPAVHIHGERGTPEIIRPRELPTCNVLEMDCEGAELEILRNVEFRSPPHTIIVEVHPNLDSPESEVRDELETLGFEVIKRRTENEAENVSVLTAKHVGRDT